MPQVSPLHASTDSGWLRLRIRRWLAPFIPWIVDDRPYSARIRVEGWLAIILILMVGGVAYQSSNNLVFLVMAAMCAVYLVSGVLSAGNYRGFSTRLRLPLRVRAGEELKVDFVLTNHHARFPLYALGFDLELRRISSRSASKIAQEGRVFFLQLSRGESRTQSAVFPKARRGLYEVGLARSFSQFPFGFIERQIRYAEKIPLCIWPCRIPLNSGILESRAAFGNLASPRKGTGSDLYALRPYRMGDSPRHVHWKITARTGRQMVREFAQEQNPRVTLVLDTRGGEEADRMEAFEKAVSAAGMLAEWWLKQGISIGLWTPSVACVPREGIMTSENLWRELAALEGLPRDATVTWPVSSEKWGTLVFIQWDHPAPGDMMNLPLSTIIQPMTHDTVSVT